MITIDCTQEDSVITIMRNCWQWISSARVFESRPSSQVRS